MENSRFKYRVWLNGLKNMCEVKSINFDSGIVYVKHEEHHNGYDKSRSEVYDIVGCHAVPIMQFTGLTDKNGKEIYEGDIVQCGGSKYIVHFSEDRAGWFPFATDDGCGCCSYDLCNNLNSYVIGNIHENKDLLNG